MKMKAILFLTLLSSSVLLAQAPDLPKVPDSGAAEKAAARARQTEAAAKAAESAKSAEKAQAASESSAKADAAQKAAEKASSAQQAAEKANAAQQAASKAESAQKAAEKANVAQQAASKAEAAQKAAEKASVAQKAAEKAGSAQKVAEKASVAQQAASKAEVAQKAAEKASVAQTAAGKADSAEQAAEKASVAEKASFKAQAAQQAVSRAETAGKSGKVSATDPPVPKPSATSADPARQAAEKNSDSGKKFEKGQTAQSSKTTSEKSQEPPSGKQKATSPGDPKSSKTASSPGDSKEEKKSKTQAVRSTSTEDMRAIATKGKKEAEQEVKGAILETRTDLITSIGISPDKARALAGRLADGDEEARGTTTLVVQAAATLQLVGADTAKAKKVLEEIIDRRLTDGSSGGTTDSLVGAVVIETLTGTAPNPNTPRLGEVARALIDAKGTLQTVGVEDTDVGTEVITGIVQRGLRGAAAKSFVITKVQPIIDAVAKDPANQPAEAGQTEPQAGGIPAVVGRVPGASEERITPVPVEAVEGAGASAGDKAAGEAAASAPAAPAPAEVVAQAPERTEVAPAQPAARDVAPAPGRDSGGNSAPVAGASDAASSHTVTVQSDGPRTVYTERDASGNVVETTTIIELSDGRESVVVKDANGNVTDAYTHNGPQETVVTGQRGGGGGTPAEQPGDGNGGSPPADNSGDNSGDSDSSAQADASPTPPPADDADDTPEEPAETADTETAENSTPNPLARDRGTGLELFEKTEGRLGGQESRNARRGIALAASGGGAAGPNPENSTTSGVLLTPGEQKNFERLLGIKAGGAVTNPSPLDNDAVVVTDRDLRDLGLRGNGGAKGPTDTPAAPPPQDPASPLVGPAPVSPPSSRVNVLPEAAAGQAVQFRKIEVNVDKAAVEAVGN